MWPKIKKLLVLGLEFGSLWKNMQTRFDGISKTQNILFSLNYIPFFLLLFPRMLTLCNAPQRKTHKQTTHKQLINKQASMVLSGNISHNLQYDFSYLSLIGRERPNNSAFLRLVIPPSRILNWKTFQISAMASIWILQRLIYWCEFLCRRWNSKPPQNLFLVNNRKSNADNSCFKQMQWKAISLLNSRSSTILTPRSPAGK